MSVFKVKMRAFLIHFLISATIISTVSLAFIGSFYAYPLYELEGILNILPLLAVVDIVIGPVITFIIFRPNKPGLKVDLWIISALQLLALAYGCYNFYQARPIFSVFVKDRFTLVAIKDFDQMALPKNLSVDFMQSLKVIGAKVDSEDEAQQSLRETIFEGKPDLEFRAKFYVPYEQIKSQVSKSLQPIEEENLSTEDRSQLEAMLSEYKLDMSSIGYLPIIGKAKDMTVILKREDQTIIGYLETDPWAHN